MIKKTLFYVSGVALAVLPSVAFAQLSTRTTKPTLYDLIWYIISYANVILVLMIGVAVVVFVFYVIKYFIIADADRKEGGKYVMYSLIGFFVVLSFWGLVNILLNTFGFNNTNSKPGAWSAYTDIFPTSSSGGSNTNYNTNTVSNRTGIGQ
jgi:cellulose synthase/poly-beta-1,6-N-acetylglucosamine synthase-like glycosyltransferase